MDLDMLENLIRTHDAADDAERAHQQAMMSLLAGTDTPCSRHHFRPGHFTASAFVLSADATHVLLIHHSKLHRWLQPGGHIDPEDTDIFAAARREVEEETGVSDMVVAPGFPQLLDVDVHNIPANPKKGEEAHKHFDVRLLFRALRDDVQAGSDAMDARWVALDEVEKWETDASVMRAIRRLRSRLACQGPEARRVAPAAARNRAPIREVLSRVFPARARVLEVASGSGEHAVWMSDDLDVAWWQPSDVDAAALASIEAWRGHAAKGRVRPAVFLDVNQSRWHVGEVDAVFCANMVHISPWTNTLGLLAGAARALSRGGVLVLYGPYRVAGEHTAPSNAAFDQMLQQRDASWGLRDLEAVVSQAAQVGLRWRETIRVPANNLMLVFSKLS